MDGYIFEIPLCANGKVLSEKQAAKFIIYIFELIDYEYDAYTIVNLEGIPSLILWYENLNTCKIQRNIIKFNNVDTSEIYNAEKTEETLTLKNAI